MSRAFLTSWHHLGADTDEELVEWQSNFENSVATLKLKIRKSEEELRHLQMQSLAEKERYTKDCTRKGSLQAEAEVLCTAE